MEADVIDIYIKWINYVNEIKQNKNNKHVNVNVYNLVLKSF